MKKIGVIGAGAAGLIAAGRAAERGHRVFLFEKNKLAGRKLRITGKGRCNITNICQTDTLISNVPGNGRFLYSSFNAFSNVEVMEFFEKRGLSLKVERGGRVFPVSDRAGDVADTLIDYAVSNGVEILYQTAVNEVLTKDSRVTGVKTDSGKLREMDAVILSTGGVTYPGTGSTGDGHKMAQKLGHILTPLKPSLVPLNVKENWVKELQGLSLKNVAIRLEDKNGDVLYSDFGEMLFTHFGVSGPVVLSASRHILQYDYRDVFFVIDLKPALTEEKVDQRIQRDFMKYSRKQFKNALDDLLPKRLIPVIIKLSRIPPEKPVHQILKEERQYLARLLKGLVCEINGSRSIDEGIVTAGGVSVREIVPNTMASKKIENLYFAGEIIDVDAYTGGYNLTIAFSTGYTAGNSV